MSENALTNTRVSDEKRKEIQQRVGDGFANFASRVGASPEMNNQLSESMYTFNFITRNRTQLEAMYRGSWVVGIMVDAIADDMTRAGITITSNEAAEDIEDLQAYLKQLRIFNSINDVIKWARLYGGAIGVLMIEGQDLSTPLRMETVSKGQFTGIATYDRWQVLPDLTTVIPSGPDIGLPAYYSIITSADLIAAGEVGENGTVNSNINYGAMAAQGIRVHHSRLVRSIGVKLPFFQAITEQMWGMSVIERVLDRLFSFDNSTMSSANLINHANLRTIGIEGLREILSAGGKAEESLIKMFEYMRLLQSNEGITLLDKNDEFKSTAYTFSGLSDMMLQFGQQLSGASGVPLVRMFGQSPAGLNSSGESDIRNYYDNINAQQEDDLRPAMTKILRLAYQSRFGKPAPLDMQFAFTPLWQMTPEQKANVGKTVTDTVLSAFEAGAIKQPTMLKELRKISNLTGVFTNITDEEIKEAEEDGVPLPGGELDLDENAMKKLKATDSLFNRVMKKLSGKK